tara:strand:- start:211 stop:864 length:654 start_codon:yes stop_codon:yes gene_type:complete
MATSGTFTFRLTVEEMVVEPYERCGIRPSMLTQYDAESARRSLNLLFADWSTRGINYWTMVEDTQTVTQGTSSYALDAGVLDIFTMVLRRDTTDTVMERISVTEYHELPNKTTQGRPTSWMLDRQYTPTIYVWQTPENSTDVLRFWQMKQMEDITTAGEDADIPYRWTEALCAGLAAKLALKKKPEMLQVLEPLADKAFDHASTDEREKASLRIVPA